MSADTRTAQRGGDDSQAAAADPVVGDSAVSVLSSPSSGGDSSRAAFVLRARAASTAAEAAQAAAVPRFSPALEATLKQVCPSDDPLDQPDFDPIAYINAQFPDESSLVGGKLDTFLGGLRRRVVGLNDSITRDVREHSQARSQTARAISQASGSIHALFGKVALIKSKAEQSESMVQEICRDIRALDTAKKHLTNTIRALRNLHMLVSAVAQLDHMVAEKQYREAADRLRAVQDLFTLFESYGDVPKIRSLQSSVDATRALMREQLTAEFHRALPSPLVAQEPMAGLMRDACAVVDVLDMAPAARAASGGGSAGGAAAASESSKPISVSGGTHFKSDLLGWFSSLQLDEYTALFSPGKDGATMEQIERRYAWFKNWVRLFDQRYSRVFPAAWNVPALVAREFCRMTRVHVNKMLAAQQAKGALDVNMMIQSLLATIEFERGLNAKYRPRIPAPAASASAAADAEDAAAAAEENMEATVDQIKRKYARKTSTERRLEEEAKLASERDAERNAAAAAASGGVAAGSLLSSSSTAPPVYEFKGMISECFTPYMAAYVEMERKNIADMVDRFEREEKWAAPDSTVAPAAGTDSSSAVATAAGAGAAVMDRFASSNELFQYIKNSINRCTKLSRGQTLFSLYEEYKRGLAAYCALLDSKLPRKPEGQALSQNEIVLCCYIINTSEYISETLPGLGERLSGLIEPPHNADVDLSSVGDEYGAEISSAVAALVASMWTRLHRVLAAMTKLPWGAMSAVGDESAYVGQVAAVFREELPLVAGKLSPRYHPFFCNQVASTFIPRFVDAIYKCRSVGGVGAQQMSLDAHALKNVLLNVPNIAAAAIDPAGGKGAKAGGAGGASSVAQKSYARYVNTEMSKAEALIKTLVSPNERLIVTFKALLPKSNVDDLMRIMHLRGLKRAEQESLVSAYNATVAPEDQLKLKAERSDKFSSIFAQLRSN